MLDGLLETLDYSFLGLRLREAPSEDVEGAKASLACK